MSEFGDCKTDPEDKKVKNLLVQHSQITAQLNKLGIIRSQKIVADLGEAIACKYLNLKLAKVHEKGYDCVDNQGKKYQVKTTRVGPSQNYGWYNVFHIKNFDFDFLVCVALGKKFNLLKLFLIPKNVVMLDKKKRIILSNKFLKKHEEVQVIVDKLK